MQRMNAWSTVGRILVMLGAVGLSGCPQVPPLAATQSAPEAAIPVKQNAATDTAIADYPPAVVSYEVCGEIADWERLSLAEQTSALMENPRYGAELETEPLQELFEKFWNESLITFTTYGLSARTEPVELSGVWTGIDAMSACYEGDRPTAINAGELAEMWLIGYQVVDFVWTGDRYQITVEPTTTGLRFIQFERLEAEAALPLVVLETNGAELTVASGDWSE